MRTQCIANGEAGEPISHNGSPPLAWNGGRVPIIIIFFFPWLMMAKIALTV
jgi:hypothetical protein